MNKIDRETVLEKTARNTRIHRRVLLRGAGIGALVLLAGGTAWMGGRGKVRLWFGKRAMMGTTASILIAHDSRDVPEAAAAEAFAAMTDSAARLTRFDPASDVGRVNDAPGRAVPVGAETEEVVQASLALARTSDGAFDPTLDRLVSLWGFHMRQPPRHLPNTGDLAPWRAAPGYRLLIPGDRTLRLDAPHLGIDLGGIAKGHAIDRAVAALRSRNIDRALVEAGGDLYALGSHPDGSPWRVGVRHPRKPGDLLEVVEVRDEAVATSGDYENHFEAGGERYAHLLDPHTGRPARHYRSLTVRATSARLADGLATAGSTTAPEALPRLLKRFGERSWLAMDDQGRLLRG